jgi:hypothetical protein
LWVDDQAELRKLASPAAQNLCGIRRLLGGSLSDFGHAVDRWQISNEKDRLEIGRLAYLTLLDHDAPTGSCRERIDLIHGMLLLDHSDIG